MPFEFDTLLLITAISFVAYVLFALSGFGSNLVTVPLLGHFLPLTFVLPTLALLDFFAAARIGFQSRGHLLKGEIGWLLPSLGLGIVAASTIVPSLASCQLAVTWLALGAVCALLAALTWRYWPNGAPAAAAAEQPSPGWPRLSLPILLLCLAYTLNAIGYLPHTLFWADYITRELHQPLAVASFFWACFGVGAACGPYLTGVIADRFGLNRTLAAAFGLKALGVALPLGTVIAIYLSEYASPKLREVLKPILELLSAVPTVVFGYFALLFVTPLLQKLFPQLPGFSLLSAGLVMGIMIVPYIASLSEIGRAHV